MIPTAPLILAFLLVISCVAALLVRKLLWSLIILFYSSLLLGAILFWYGATYAGLFHIITFAGAVSVMFMVIIMLTGEDAPEPRQLNRQVFIGSVLTLAGFIPFLLAITQLQPIAGRYEEQGLLSGSTVDELSFLWAFRSWDLFFVLLLIFAAILGVINLFSREGEVE